MINAGGKYFPKTFDAIKDMSLNLTQLFFSKKLIVLREKSNHYAMYSIIIGRTLYLKRKFHDDSIKLILISDYM